MDNIIHCPQISNLFVAALVTGRKTSFSGLFRSECKYISYLPTMYVYCVYTTMSKTTTKLFENSRDKCRSNYFQLCPLFALILLPVLVVAQHESGTRNTISWSVTVCNKDLSSQCNLTAQIEPA